MKKYKKKKYRFHTDIIIIIVLIIAIFFVLIGISVVSFIKDTSAGNINVKPIKFVSKITKDNYQNYFKYSGQVIHENVLDGRYLSVLYNDDNGYSSHLIDLNLGKEITIKGLFRNNDLNSFSSQISKLLKLKYPSSIVKKLSTMEKAYFFGEKELNIYYNNHGIIDSTRDFTLKVDYNEIKDYLAFKPLLNEKYQNENGFDYDPNKVTIAFTFDDGPNENYTLDIVNALEDYKMSATFFMVGYKLDKYANIVKKVDGSHSEVGYHSYSHTRFTEQTIDQIKSDFKTSDDIFYRITGNHLQLTRPPYGSYNNGVLKCLDTSFIRWNIDTNDWQYQDTDYIVNYVLDNIKNHEIILFHDSYKTSAEAAYILMEKLYNMDIQVVSVSELAKIANTPLEKHQIYYSFD